MFKHTWVQSVVPLLFAGCLSCSSAAQRRAKASVPEGAPGGGYLGFDRNVFPGDDTLSTIAKRFSFVGYRLSNPPLTQSNTWTGKRRLIASHNLGFLALWNGRVYKEILEKTKDGTSAAALGAATLTPPYKRQSKKVFQLVQPFSSIKKMVDAWFKSSLIISLPGLKR